jgi:hypothetical protein
MKSSVLIAGKPAKIWKQVFSERTYEVLLQAIVLSDGHFLTYDPENRRSDFGMEKTVYWAT